MKLTLTPTSTLEEVNGTPCRRWEGADEAGTPVVAWVAMVSPQTHDAALVAAFDAALKELRTVERGIAISYRFVM